MEVLADAGVELGSNYELPIIDETEAMQNLNAARAVVEQSLPWESPPDLVPYRQASVAARNSPWGPSGADRPSDDHPMSRCACIAALISLHRY